MNVGVILVQIWCNALHGDTHDIHDIKRRCQNSKRQLPIGDYFDTKTALISMGAVFRFVGETCGLPRANTVRPYGCVAVQFVKTLPSYLHFIGFMVQYN